MDDKTDPTEDEIKRMCEDIRSKWSKKKLRSKQVGIGRVEWEIPVVKTKDLPDPVRRMLESDDKESEQ